MLLKSNRISSKDRIVNKRTAMFLIGMLCFAIEHTSAQNVGIGIETPSKRLTVNGSILLDATNKNIGTLDSAALLFGTGGEMGIVGRQNGGWNDLMFFTGAQQRLRIGTNGSVMVNVPSNILYPDQFVVNGKSSLDILNVNTSAEINKLKIDSSIEMENLFRVNNVSYTVKIGENLPNAVGKLQVNGGLTLGNGDARFLERVAIGGIGTFVDHALSVHGDSYLTGNVNMNAVNPIIQLKQNYENKGFLQLSDDNIRIGTNSGNTSGNFVIRNNGADRVTVDASGNMDVQGALTVNNGKAVLYNSGGAAQLKYYTQTATFSANLPGHGMSGELSISFAPGTFTVKPKVFAGDIVATGGTVGELFRVQLVLYGATTTGCKARLINTSPNPVNYSITWNIICIGE